MAARYAPIGEYGVVGDLYTVALVGMDGSIDFLCLPHFDSPSVFAALVDAERGGRFQLAPVLDRAARQQLYLPDTNALLTRFLDAEGVAEVGSGREASPEAGVKGRRSSSNRAGACGAGSMTIRCA
jgi:GH15 family glucan-1,4-alpha-glucosidase